MRKVPRSTWQMPLFFAIAVASYIGIQYAGHVVFQERSRLEHGDANWGVSIQLSLSTYIILALCVAIAWIKLNERFFRIALIIAALAFTAFTLEGASSYPYRTLLINAASIGGFLLPTFLMLAFERYASLRKKEVISNSHVKILFRYYSDVLEEETVETMWAVVVDAKKDLYKLDSIPFYGPLVASDDIVYARYSEHEQMLTYEKTAVHSGNSIVQVIVIDENVSREVIRDKFRSMGCNSEGLKDRFFSMEIPAGIDYTPVRTELKTLEKEGTIFYAEPCLSEQHQCA